MSINYVPPRVAATRLGVSTKTLERWLEGGKIEGIFTQGGQRRYNLDSILLSSTKASDEERFTNEIINLLQKVKSPELRDRIRESLQ